MPKRRSLESAGISDAQYFQIMERVAEQNYKDWSLPNSDAALIQALNDNTYDYKGYYNKYPNSRANASTHWTDEFKTVYHPTFSKESRYSGKKSQYNPKGLVGGTWYGDYFLPSVPQMIERSKRKKGGDTNGDSDDNSGLFGNEAVDNVASFLPILGTLEDGYGFYKNPTWANAGWLAASLASDIFTGGMAGRAVKALRLANKAHDVAQAANRTTRAAWNTSKQGMAAGTGRGADNLRVIRSLQAAGATRQAAIRRANDALFDAGVKIGVDQGVNAFLNAAQLDMLPDLRSKRKEGGIHIAPSKRGTFTAAATKHGMGVQEFASRVLRNKDRYSPAMVKKANFARNASKWNH